MGPNGALTPAKLVAGLSGRYRLDANAFGSGPAGGSDDKGGENGGEGHTGDQSDAADEGPHYFLGDELGRDDIGDVAPAATRA
jgi:hypothetical protein